MKIWLKFHVFIVVYIFFKTQQDIKYYLKRNNRFMGEYRKSKIFELAI